MQMFGVLEISVQTTSWSSWRAGVSKSRWEIVRQRVLCWLFLLQGVCYVSWLVICSPTSWLKRWHWWVHLSVHVQKGSGRFVLSMSKASSHRPASAIISDLSIYVHLLFHYCFLNPSFWVSIHSTPRLCSLFGLAPPVFYSSQFKDHAYNKILK